MPVVGPQDDDTATASDLLAPTRQALPFVLIRAREMMLRELRPMMAQAGVSEPQWRILRVLTERDSCSVQALAEAACLQATSVSRILQSMVERGLVLRVQDATNRRRQIVTVTEEGRAIITRFAPMSRAITDGFATRFGLERYADLVATLEEFIAQCGTEPDPD